MEVTLALLADAVNVSREGKLNVLGNFTQIYTRSLPTTHPLMELVLRFDASPAEVGQTKALRIVLLDSDGQPQGPGIEAEYLVPPANKAGSRVRSQMVVRLVNTSFLHEGDYEVAIMINGETKAEVPLSVVLLPIDVEVIQDGG